MFDWRQANAMRWSGVERLGRRLDSGEMVELQQNRGVPRYLRRDQCARRQVEPGVCVACVFFTWFPSSCWYHFVVSFVALQRDRHQNHEINRRPERRRRRLVRRTDCEFGRVTCFSLAISKRMRRTRHTADGKALSSLKSCRHH